MLCGRLLFPVPTSQTQMGKLEEERSSLALITLLVDAMPRITPVLKHVDAASVTRQGFRTSIPN